MPVLVMLCGYKKDLNKLFVIRVFMTFSAQGQFSLYCLASDQSYVSKVANKHLSPLVQSDHDISMRVPAAAVYKFKAGGIIKVLVNLTEKAEGNAMHNLAMVKAAGAQVASCEGDATADTECKLPFEAGTVTVKRVAIPFQTGNVSICERGDLSLHHRQGSER